MENKKHVDFISAVVFIILAVYVIFESMHIYKDAGELLYESPGLMPLVLGCGLLLTGIMLLVRSLKAQSLAVHVEKLKKGATETLSSKTFQKALIGIAIMFIYVYLLLEKIGYTLSSAVFMIVLMLFLNIENILESENSSEKMKIILKIIVIPIAVVAVTWVTFQKGFGVPLP